MNNYPEVLHFTTDSEFYIQKYINFEKKIPVVTFDIIL